MTEQTQMQRPLILVAVLHTGQVRWELSAWLNHVIATEKRAGVMVKYYGCDQRSHPVNSNRNRILADTPQAMDAVMMIDEDTVPIPEAIEVAFIACPESKGGLGKDVVLAPVPIVVSAAASTTNKPRACHNRFLFILSPTVVDLAWIQDRRGLCPKAATRRRSTRNTRGVRHLLHK